MADNEWIGTLNFNIQSCRLLHDHLEYSLKMRPGSPARPAEEQEMLLALRDTMFAMRMDYSLDSKN
jgi:hypothetical protein